MQATLWSVNALSVELGRDRRALARDLEGLKPDEETRKGKRTDRRWKLARVIAHLYASVEADIDFDNQRERLAAAQAEKVEMENAVRRGTLADVAAVQGVWADHILAARAKLLSLPSKLGPQLTNATDPAAIAGRIRAEIYVALNELAEADAAPGGEPHRDAPGSDDLLAAAA